MSGASDLGSPIDVHHWERPDHSQELATAMRNEDPDGSVFARLFRQSFDQIYDGQNTGRYSISQLSKTESAHIGSIVEINIRRAFDGFIRDGKVMDFDILGHEVDCKYSKAPFGWMIPSEALGHHAMVCHADDDKGMWRVGFVQIRDDILTRGGNRDGKRSISSQGRANISWAFYDEPLIPNTLLQLSSEDRRAILNPKSGQSRINELFRRAQQRLIPRGIIATVAQQKDYMKRVRGNGGARSALAAEGIVILGDYKAHRLIAETLELPVPGPGDSVAVRLVPSEPNDPHPCIELEGQRWRVAEGDDPIHHAPAIVYTGSR